MTSRGLLVAVVLLGVGLLGLWNDAPDAADDQAVEETDGPARAAPPSPGSLVREWVEPLPAKVSVPVPEAVEGVRDPWDPEVLEELPKDRFGQPTIQRPFLHWSLNHCRWGENAEKGLGLSYQPDLDEILAGLPEEAKAAGRASRKELQLLLRDYLTTARAVEAEHWRERLHDYHLAVERGDYVVVDNSRDPSVAGSAANVAKHLAALNLGTMNRDYFYVTSTSLDDGGRAGAYAALIYLRREAYPRAFDLFDELMLLRRQAELAVRDYLGVPR